MSKWFEFYKEKAFDPIKRLNFLDKYQVYLKMLDKNQGTINAEWGCGTGLVSLAISHMFPEALNVLLDNDSRVMGIAKVNFYRFGAKKKPLFLEHDIRNPLAGEYRLSHSHGVLEHFSKKDCSKIIKNMRDVSHKVICYVPTDRYTHKSFGDERLMSPSKWKKLFNPTEMIEFNDGKDLILKWR